MLVAALFVFCQPAFAQLYMVTSGDSTGQRLELYFDGNPTPKELIPQSDGKFISGLIANGSATTPIYAFVRSGSLVDLYSWDRLGNLVGTYPIDLGVTSATGDFSVGELVFSEEEVSSGTEYKDVWSVDQSSGDVLYIGESNYFYANTVSGETLTGLKSVSVDDSSGDIFVAVNVYKGGQQGCFSRIVKLSAGGSTSEVVNQGSLEFCNFVGLVHDPNTGAFTGLSTLITAESDLVDEVYVDLGTNSVYGSSPLFTPNPGTEVGSIAHSIDVNYGDSIFVLVRDPATGQATIVEVDRNTTAQYLAVALPTLAPGESYDAIALPEPSVAVGTVAGAGFLAFFRVWGPRIGAGILSLFFN